MPGRRRRGVRARAVRRDARDRAAGPVSGARGARHQPGRGYVRIALVPGIADCVEAARRIVEFCRWSSPIDDFNEDTDALTTRSKRLIDAAFERRADITPGNVPTDLVAGARRVIDGAERRHAARRREDRRRVGHAPVDQEGGAAVLPHARQPRDATAAATTWFDKVPLRFDGYTDAQFREGGFRVVPPAVGAHRRLHRPQRRPDAVVREHRRLRGRGHDGGHLGHGRLVRADRQERAPLGRRRHRRRARAAAGQPDDHRGQLLHRRPLRDRRRA